MLFWTLYTVYSAAEQKDPKFYGQKDRHNAANYWITWCVVERGAQYDCRLRWISTKSVS